MNYIQKEREWLRIQNILYNNPFILLSKKIWK